MTECSSTDAAKATEATSLAAAVQQLHKLRLRKRAIWHVSLSFCQARVATTAETKESPATAATAEQQQQRKQRHKERQVALQSLRHQQHQP